MNDQRIKELAKLPKWRLAQMHTANGGLMGMAIYQQWTKDELLNAVIEDERLMTREQMLVDDWHAAEREI